MPKQILTLLLLLLFCYFFPQEAVAQQSIINAPSSSVLPKGGLRIKQSTGFDPFYGSEFVNLSPSVTYGLGHGMNVYAGASTRINDSTVVRGNFGFKKVFYVRESSRLSVGGRISPYFNGGGNADTFAFSHMSHNFRKTKTSITAGAYVGSRRNYLPNTGGFLIGLEQVIIPRKLRVAVDWLSGETSYGTMGVGLKYRPTKTISMTTAVLLPNEQNKGVSFKVSLSKFVSLKDFRRDKKGAL